MRRSQLVLTDLHDGAWLGEDIVDSVARDHHHTGEGHHQTQGLGPGWIHVILSVPAVLIMTLNEL